MTTRRSLEERIEELESKIGKNRALQETLTMRRDDLVAKKEGRTVMGTKEERKAFVRAFDKHRGFGLTYVQALAVLADFEAETRGHPEPRPALLEALQDRGLPLIAPYLPGYQPAQEQAADKDQEAHAPQDGPLELRGHPAFAELPPAVDPEFPLVEGGF